MWCQVSSNSVLFVLLLLLVCCVLQSACCFRTGLESGLICYQCVSTQPGCGLSDFISFWSRRTECPRVNDRCVKLIERRGANTLVTRDCLSHLEGHRVDVPADRYSGCRPANKDVKLGQHTFNRIKELDVKRSYYDNTTWCMCHFDHWCNAADPKSRPNTNLILLISLIVATRL